MICEQEKGGVVIMLCIYGLHLILVQPRNVNGADLREHQGGIILVENIKERDLIGCNYVQNAIIKNIKKKLLFI